MSKLINYEERLTKILNGLSTPLYVFDSQGFIDNFRNLCDAFRVEYENYIPGYSYKTNYTPHICKLVKQFGGYAEVVSDMEYYIAKKIGYENRHIIYNGPNKGPLMEEHILNGGISNIDNEAEACRVVEIAGRNLDVEIRIGIRINTDIGAGFISRFGLDVGSAEMTRVVDMLKSTPNVRLVGLHMHVSRARYLSAWQRRIDNVLEAADKYIDGVPDYIDVGSGMFADMEEYLHNQFTVEVPTYEDYARVVAGTMAKHYAHSDKKPVLMSEPGTTVVSRYLSLVATVKAIKTVKGRHIAILDCDIHDAGETCQMMKSPYTIIRQGTGCPSGVPVDLTGFTCLEQDTLFKDFPEPVRVGDIIEFRNVGGYSVVYKPPFIMPSCPIIAFDGDKMDVVKGRDTYENVFRTFKF